MLNSRTQLKCVQLCSDISLPSGFFQTGHIGGLLWPEAMRCVYGLMAMAMVVAQPTCARADGIQFLPEDAQIACRAILPQCFTQQGWHRLCQNDPDIAKSHQQACRKAAIGIKDAVD